MKPEVLYIETTTTERRTYLGGTDLETHRRLIEGGFRYDRLASQYRRTERKHVVYQDGVANDTQA